MQTAGNAENTKEVVSEKQGEGKEAMNGYIISLVIREKRTGGEIRISGNIEKLYGFLRALLNMQFATERET